MGLIRLGKDFTLRCTMQLTNYLLVLTQCRKQHISMHECTAATGLLHVYAVAYVVIHCICRKS